jgi:hypothetical protein
MFAAGPGTITAVGTLAAVHTPAGFPVTAIVAAVVGATVTFAMLLVAIGLGSRLGQGTQAMVAVHGAGGGVYGNAIRADGIKSILQLLAPVTWVAAVKSPLWADSVL